MFLMYICTCKKYLNKKNQRHDTLNSKINHGFLALICVNVFLLTFLVFSSLSFLYLGL